MPLRNKTLIQRYTAFIPVPALWGAAETAYNSLAHVGLRPGEALGL